jgi:hypothetical protein
MKWLVALVISQVTDVLTTGFVLYRGGHEANPIALAVASSGGIPALLLMKCGFIVLAALIVYRATRYGASHIRLTNVVVGTMAVTFLVGSAWNFLVGLVS